MLVTYASRNGATAEIAATIAAGLRDAATTAIVLPVGSVTSLAGFNAFVVGSAVYVGAWRASASAFLRDHAAVLAEHPLWLFSSGPVDGSACSADLVSPVGVAEIAGRLGAREHVVFGGRLLAASSIEYREAMGTAAEAADYRDFGDVRDWAERIAAAVRTEGVRLPTRAR